MACYTGNFPSNPNCFEVFNSGCVFYDGPDLCVDLPTLAYLNDVLVAITNAYCAGGSDFEGKDWGVLSSYNISNQESFFESVSDILTKILGTQNPGTVTSISDLKDLINSLTETLTQLDTVPVLPCYQPLADLPEESDLKTVLESIQQVICNLTDQTSELADQYVKISATDTTAGRLIDKLQAGAGVTLAIIGYGGNEKIRISIPNTLPANLQSVDSNTVNLTISGEAGDGVKMDVKVDPDPSNSLIQLPDGMFTDAQTILSLIINNPVYSNLFCGLCFTTTTTTTTSTTTTTTTAAPTTTTTSTTTTTTTLVPTTTTTTTTSTTTTTTTLPVTVNVTNTLSGQAIVGVLGINGFNLIAPPVLPGEAETGNHTGVNGPIEVTVNGSALIAGNLRVYVNGVAVFPCYNIPSGLHLQTYYFNVVAPVGSLIRVSLSSGTC